ncbi:MAG: hypothetical protein JWM68_647 [Verrucomicrobiales bacterium]|nr:hypothetical protein [Verrucomicrobiales bacterium]
MCYLENQYRATHSVPKKSVTEFLIFSHDEEGDVSLSMLGWGNILKRVVGVAAIYALAHSLVGRIIAALAHLLWRANARLYTERDDTWTPEMCMIYGSLWPLSALLIPLLVIGLVLGGLYRILW